MNLSDQVAAYIKTFGPIKVTAPDRSIGVQLEQHYSGMYLLMCSFEHVLFPAVTPSKSLDILVTECLPLSKPHNALFHDWCATHLSAVAA